LKYSEASGSHEGRPETTRSQEWRPGRYDGAVDAGAAPQRYYYHFDGLGSVAALSNAAGELVETYEYDVYGDTTVKDTAGTILSKSSIGNPYGFTGRRVDVETGLYYYRARYYDADMGRFLSVDPLGIHEENTYAYCYNDPVNWVDPLGLYAAGGTALPTGFNLPLETGADLGDLGDLGLGGKPKKKGDNRGKDGKRGKGNGKGEDNKKAKKKKKTKKGESERQTDEAKKKSEKGGDKPGEREKRERKKQKEDKKWGPKHPYKRQPKPDIKPKKSKWGLLLDLIASFLDPLLPN